MKVWLVTIGEPVPVRDGEQDRLLRTGTLARVLALAGHEVTWWTSTFHHFKKRQLYSKSTTVFIDGIRVRLLKGVGYSRNLSISRMIDHWQVARSFSREIEREEVPDVVLTSLPTVGLARAAVRFGCRKQIPVAVDMRDMWPDIFVEHVPRVLRPVVRIGLQPLFRGAREAAGGATAITGITDEYVDWGLGYAGRPRSNADRAFPHAYRSTPPAEARLAQAHANWDALGVGGEDGLTACFFGTMNDRLDVDGILEAARLIYQSSEPVRFVLCGEGDRLDRFRRQAAGLPHVLFTGWIDAASIYALLRRSHVGLDPLPDRRDFLATINNKAIEYLSAGLPVVSCPDRGVLARLLASEGCGTSYPHGDAGRLAGILVDLARRPEERRRMSANATRLFDARFRAERVYGDFAAYLEELAASGAGRASAASGR